MRSQMSNKKDSEYFELVNFSTWDDSKLRYLNPTER